EGRAFRLELAVAEQYSRNQGVSDAVIAAAEISVVLENTSWDTAKNGLPSRPVVPIVTNEKIGSLVGIWALVSPVGAIDSRNHGHTILGITDSKELPLDFLEQRLNLSSSLNDSIALPITQVHV